MRKENKIIKGCPCLMCQMAEYADKVKEDRIEAIWVEIRLINAKLRRRGMDSMKSELIKTRNALTEELNILQD